MVEIRFTRKALVDLQEIEQNSITCFGKKVAAKYMTDIEEVLETISEYPHILQEKSFSKHTTFFCVREHMLVFAILDNIIYLLTVRYGGMDLESIIPREEPTLIHEAQILHERLKSTLT